MTILRLGIWVGSLGWLYMALAVASGEEGFEMVPLLLVLAVGCYLLYGIGLLWKSGRTYWLETMVVEAAITFPLIVPGLALVVGGGIWGLVRWVRRPRGRMAHGG